jgi:uncharacterized protein (DUF362 family)
MTDKPTVILAGCPTYDVDRIARVVGAGLDTLGLRPSGRTLVKPNVVASGPKFPDAYTRPEFTEGVIRALQSRAHGMTELAVGERCAITVPTRLAFREAGYYDMFERVGCEHYHFEETTQVEIPLYHEGRLRDSLFTPEPVARADFFVNCPKFKAHPWTTVTFSMKNYIGIQDDRHRLIDHDHLLNEKVADLQYIVQPQFIAIDAIVAGEGRMLTPIPFPLGMVIMGDNQVAFDAVCCHIIGLDPLEVDHIRLAHERGFGPVELGEIDIVGDVSLELARQKAAGFRVGLIRVEEYFRGTSIQAHAGTPPGDKYDYCWGGCPGALQEAIEVVRLFDDSTDDKLPRTHVVFGQYDGEIDASPGEKVIFIGDCAQFQGDIAGRKVDIESTYVDRSSKSIHDARHEDVFGKIGRVAWNWARHASRKDVLRLQGCPVSVAEQILMLVSAGRLNNPYLDPQQNIPFVTCYLSWRTRSLLQKVIGSPYQVAGPTRRGRARPHQNLPPSNAEAPLEE